jgi:sugar phosphate permease
MMLERHMSLSSVFKNFLYFLKPAPHLPLIEDSEEVKSQYKYWRWRVFYSMYMGYAFYYLSRKSFTFAIPAMKMDLGFRNDELGILSSVFAIAYGISKFTSGMLADRSNGYRAYFDWYFEYLFRSFFSFMGLYSFLGT